MTTFNLKDVNKALESATNNEENQKGISFENKNLKLDTVNDGMQI